jgi:hypothetical protein
MIIATQKLNYNPSYETPIFHSAKKKMKSLTTKTDQLNKNPLNEVWSNKSPRLVN